MRTQQNISIINIYTIVYLETLYLVSCICIFSYLFYTFIIICAQHILMSTRHVDHIYHIGLFCEYISHPHFLYLCTSCIYYQFTILQCLPVLLSYNHLPLVSASPIYTYSSYLCGQDITHICLCNTYFKQKYCLIF